MSTASGAMLAPATVLGENIIKPYFKTLTDKQFLFILRTSVVVVGISSAIMANMSKSIYELARQSSAITLVSLFIPLLAGLYWKRANTIGALCSIGFGMTVWLWGEINGWKTPTILYGLGASTCAMLVGTLLTKKETAEGRQGTETSA